MSWTDILDGEIVNAAWAVAGMVTRPRESRRVAAALDTAAWADTGRLVKDALAKIRSDREIPDLFEDEAAELRPALTAHEVHGALQALLACRLTDAPETDAGRAREAVRLALRASMSSGLAEQYAVTWSEYFDEKICGLVAALEGKVGFAGLAQVRAEAYNARIVALLGAIERQAAALDRQGRDEVEEARFLERYRRQAHQRHGFLIPPDFDRRRRVPVADIYVPTRIEEADQSERSGVTRQTQPGALRAWDLAGRLGRTVLLGDPGGGKTTAANVLTSYFADQADRRIPFLVTLREYAAKTPIEWSVARHIEHNLEALYQSPAPGGLVERLLLTGRAVVIFDGLDELLDTSRRRDVSDRVEQFCGAYPLTPVLVTSRAVGYDQARLDDTQFSCYRLAGFGDGEVAEYTGKWFATQDGVAAVEAEAKARAFLTESAGAGDLRANPLLLSLMCILYRGAGSLPGDRAGVYARCAELLLRKWDEQRDLYQRVQADHLVEPTIRYLAWWLFTREDSRAEVTERELGDRAAEFLLGRGYESEDEARAAAREFIEFCRGRMWVFSEAGTTAGGDKLYAFTHRTFMEYFAAGHLAATCDTPEQLALTLAPYVDSSEWTTVGELAIQIKQAGTDRAADRIYATLLDQGKDHRDFYKTLLFLTYCVSSSRPSPATIRKLTCAILERAFESELGEASVLITLISLSPGYAPIIYDELTKRVTVMLAPGDPTARISALRFILRMAEGFRHSPQRPWVDSQVSRYAVEFLHAATLDSDFRVRAVAVDVISVAQALAMPGGLDVLFSDRELVVAYQARLGLGVGEGVLLEALADIGRFLAAHEQFPWVRAPLYDDPLPLITLPMSSLLDMSTGLDEFTGLGLAAAIAIGSELSDLATFMQAHRLSDLPMPARFRELFRDWAAGRIAFVEITNREPAG
ncbi:MAG TPA: NACHT domain-containing protein [Trebonia sp.]